MAWLLVSEGYVLTASSVYASLEAGRKAASNEANIVQTSDATR